MAIAFAALFAISPSMAQTRSGKEKPDTVILTRKSKLPVLQAAEPATAAIRKSYFNLPLSFESNQGQVDKNVKFLSRGAGYKILVAPTEAVFSFAEDSRRADRDVRLSHRDTLRIRIIGANPSPKIKAFEKLPGRSNYLVGNNPAKWRTGIQHYAKVKLEEVYPGIDLVYYGNQRNLEYDWIVAPGANQEFIRFEIRGAARSAVDTCGDLVIKLREKEIRLHKPLAYQQQEAVRTEVSAEYVLNGKNQFGFRIQRFDPSLPLVIDPILIYSTYLGGGNEYGEAIAVDPDGFAYVAGSTYSSNFPTRNPFQAKSGGGGYDAFVAKLNLSGDALVYSSYLGGNSGDAIYGIAVDSTGNAYVTGRTFSSNFPTVNPYQASYGGQGDAFVTKLNSSGSALVYSTYLGGAGEGHDWGWGIAVDAGGNAYVAGHTYSYNFPVANAFQPIYGGIMDAFVTKLNASGNELVYSTYLGGFGNDAASAIAVDPEGCAYVTGYTASGSFPTTADALQPAGPGGSSVFITKLSASGNQLIYSTYLGGNGNDYGNGIALDSKGNVYLTGYTESSNFPVLNPVQVTNKGNSDAFVSILNASGSSLLYSTYLGGSGYEVMIIGERNGGIAVDPDGNVYVVGMTSSIDFPTANPFQGTYGGKSMGSIAGGDAFVAKLSPLKSASINLAIGGGAGKLSTSGTETGITVGYTSATVDSGNAPYGVAVFSYRQSGIVVSEAAVPVSPPTKSAMIFIDHRAGVSAIPGRGSTKTIEINTGIAFAHTGLTTANITYSLRNVYGQTVALAQGTAAAGKHFAKFIDQLKDIASGFAVPSDFQFGSLEITSDQPLSILVLRGTMNERHEFLMTTTPVADLTIPPGHDSVYFPQLADGGGYTTSLLLLNTSNQSETGTLQILDNNGAPVIVNQVGGTADSSFRYSIAAGGAFRFQTDGFPTDVKTGWVRLMPDDGNPTPVAAGIFGFSKDMVLISESGVPSTVPTTHARVYVDLSGNHNTGLAIANVFPIGSNITINAYRKDGVTAAGTSKAPIPLPANGYTAGFADGFVTGLPAGFTGVLDISSPVPFAALTLRSLDNERGDFLMTTFPVADANQPAPSPVSFPQVVNGGGYVTEFILISTGEPAATTIGFYDENGVPVDLLTPIVF